MGLLINPNAALAFYYWVLGLCVALSTFVDVFVGQDNLQRFQRWLWSAPQEQHQTLQESPALGEQAEALFVMYEDFMETRYEESVLRRQLSTFPALPDEGY